MSSMDHTVVPEEIMAFVDGELSPAEMRSVEAHLRECAECAALAESFRATSAWMARWDVESVPIQDLNILSDGAQRRARKDTSARPRFLALPTWQWLVGGALASSVCAVLFLAVSRPAHQSLYSEPAAQSRARQAAGFISPPPPPAPSSVVADMLKAKTTAASLKTPAPEMYAYSAGGGGGIPLSETKGVASPPMIARTASLVVAVKNLNASRGSLEKILVRERGYVAQLTAGNAEDAAPAFQASLRIPAENLPQALTELKALGRTVTESQSGEEVTQQHADLAARLQNARETEERYRAILAQHTGKVQDILDVEEHIQNVRGQIEQMEAERKALDHRVDFATVDVQLTEEYKAQLNAPDTSVGTRMHNALVAGYRHVAEALLGLVLFGEEYVPAVVLWLLLLGTPLILLVRRYRRMRRRVS